MDMDAGNSAPALIASTEYGSEPGIMPRWTSSLLGTNEDEAPTSTSATGIDADAGLALRAARSWSFIRCAPEQQRLKPCGHSLRSTVLQSGRRFFGAARRASSRGHIEMGPSRTCCPVASDNDNDPGKDGEEEPSESLVLCERAILDNGYHPAISDTLSGVLLGGLPNSSLLEKLKYPALESTSLPKPLAVTKLPPEIIQEIYQYLGPVDFNSARHACQKWLYASVQKSLLHTMLRRGGWWSGVDISPRSSFRAYGSQLNPGEPSRISEEWWLSKCISRECSLGPNWMGDGVERPTLSSPALTHTEVPTSRRRSTRSTSLEMTSVIDFSNMVPERTEDDEVLEGGVHFTVSVCGRYLMVCEDSTIYIYCLSGQTLQGSEDQSLPNSGLSPVTSVVCPRRVLAVSMDTSCERYAVVALMVGRMGMVCELGEGKYDIDGDYAGYLHRSPMTPAPSSSYSSPRSTVASFQGVNDQFAEPALANKHESERSSYAWASESEHQKRLSVPHTVEEGTEIDAGRDWTATHAGNLATMHVETGPCTIYRDICSMDDPPRSVAICPQRKCVAFGCYGGIDLHWVDGKSGQDLNRWFPLSTPSDFLYFLPPRTGVDSARKLRLISSAAHPGDTAVLSNRLNSNRSVSSPFWNMYFHRLPTGLYSPTNDHYRAVPLSGGYHILFIDPPTGQLCLGSDAPIGGPTKLLRKIILPGPDGETPTMYTSGTDLRWGARVVAAFGDRVMLFSIPPDVLLDSLTERTRVRVRGNKEHNTVWAGGWLQRGDDKGPKVGGIVEVGGESKQTEGPWPLVISGAEVGSVEGLVDIAVKSGPGLIVWTFESCGVVKKWEIRGLDGGQGVRRMTVLREGAVVDSEFEFEAEGEVSLGKVG